MTSSIRLLNSLLFACAVLIVSFQHVLASQPAINEITYTKHLQEKLLKVYFPPRGPYNFAESELKIKIEPDGRALLESITQPPVVHGKRNEIADQCLRSAVENVNPLEAPPKEMKLPVTFLVKFSRLTSGPTIFRCVAKKI